MAEKHVISHPESFPIQPEDIDVGRDFALAFGNSETGGSACTIIDFCQARKQSWNPIKLEEIKQFHQDHQKEIWCVKEPFCLYFLAKPGIIWGMGSMGTDLEDGWILEQDDGATLLITEEFVRRCFERCPAKTV